MKYSHFYKVENKDRYKTAAHSYFLAKDEKNSYLFTESDLSTAVTRAKSNPEDIPDEDFEKERFWKPFGLGLAVGLMICMIAMFLV